MRSMLNPKRFSRVWVAGQQGLVGSDATAVILEDPQFELTGTNSADANCTYDDDHGLKLATSGGGADQCVIFPSAASDNRSIFREYSWGPENETHFECVLRTGALANSVIHLAGLLLAFPATFAVGDDADRVVLYTIAGSDTWKVGVNIGSTDSIFDTSVIVRATTVYHLAIRFDKDRRAHCSINGTEVYVTPSCTANAALLPHVGIEEASAASKTMHVRSIAMSRNWGVN